MIVTLDVRGDLADLNRLRTEGILEDFFTIAKSIRAIPYQPENGQPGMKSDGAVQKVRLDSLNQSIKNL